jgi:putative ATPase
MATAPKSNASAMAIWAAMKDARDGRTLPVPKHLRDGHYAGSKRLGHGEGYQYAHDHPGGYVDQDYLGVDKTYYEPKAIGQEAAVKQRMEALRQSVAGNDASETPPPADKP